MATAALTHGRAGERYLLGALNTTCADFFSRLGEVSGVRGPTLPFEVPGKLATFGVGLLGKLASSIGVRLSVTEQEADMASHYWYVDARKAIDELGFSPRDPMETLLDTVQDLQGTHRRERVVSCS
jgi:dihydroflavonol-4-reductase